MTVRRTELEASWREDRRQARARILDGARMLLEERPWPDLPLDEIMRAADLSRTAFYRHFEDRQALLLALLAELEDAFTEAGAPWKAAAADPPGALRDGLLDLTALFVRHGRVLQAVTEASSRSDELRDTYLAMAEGLIATTAARIAADVEAGRSAVADPDGVARALTWMNERYLLFSLGREQRVVPATVIETLATIWTRTLYGERRISSR